MLAQTVDCKTLFLTKKKYILYQELTGRSIDNIFLLFRRNILATDTTEPIY